MLGFLHVRAIVTSFAVAVPQFPRADTPPASVVTAQLQALSSRDIPAAFSLFSRARRSIFEEGGRAQGGCAALVNQQALHSRVEAALDEACPGLLGHATADVLSVLQLADRRDGRLPRWRCRVRVEADADASGSGTACPTSRLFEFTLTQQHDPPPTALELSSPTLLHDERNSARFDGFDGCWLIWSIKPDDGGGGCGAAGGRPAPPTGALPLPRPATPAKRSSAPVMQIGRDDMQMARDDMQKGRGDMQRARQDERDARGELEPPPFPTPATTPEEVLMAQLAALRAGDIASVFRLFSVSLPEAPNPPSLLMCSPSLSQSPRTFSCAHLPLLRPALSRVPNLEQRARRLGIEEGARRDVREFNVEPSRLYGALEEMLAYSCPGLLRHVSSEVLASIGAPSLTPEGVLPRWTFRIRLEDVATGRPRHFVVTLTRQSGYDGGDPRDHDGFEHCWFVWSIKPDDGGSARLPVSAVA